MSLFKSHYMCHDVVLTCAMKAYIFSLNSCQITLCQPCSSYATVLYLYNRAMYISFKNLTSVYFLSALQECYLCLQVIQMLYHSEVSCASLLLIMSFVHIVDGICHPCLHIVCYCLSEQIKALRDTDHVKDTANSSMGGISICFIIKQV